MQSNKSRPLESAQWPRPFPFSDTVSRKAAMALEQRLLTTIDSQARGMNELYRSLEEAEAKIAQLQANNMNGNTATNQLRESLELAKTEIALLKADKASAENEKERLQEAYLNLGSRCKGQEEVIQKLKAESCDFHWKSEAARLKVKLDIVSAVIGDKIQIKW